MSVLAAIAVLGLLIAVHELGHFAAARLQNIHVNRFAIGFGPVLLRHQGPETEYSLRAIPLGGFVGFPDDDPDSEIPPDDPNLLRNRPLLDRAIVISAGVIANLILAYVLLVTQIATVGIPEVHFNPGVVVPEVMTTGDVHAAEAAGLQSGDIILAVDQTPLPPAAEAVRSLMKTIQASPSQELTLTVRRDQDTLTLPITPEAGADGLGKIGVTLSPNQSITRQRTSIIGAFSSGATEFQRLTKLILIGFGTLVSNFQETAGQVASPVKIVEIGANLADSDLSSLFQFGALISINLAIINILPLPALDGGQLAFLIIEGVMGKPLPGRIQDGIMQTGIVLLMGLGVFLIVRDTVNLAIVQDLFQERP
jgi:membrane-associated protease RseP (regulator of RpoE activity)